MTKEEILDVLKSHREELRQRYDIVKIGLFGSYAKESAGPESDIDIYVEFGKRTLHNVAGAWNYLEEKLGKKVDLFYPHENVRPHMRESIGRETLFG